MGLDPVGAITRSVEAFLVALLMVFAVACEQAKLPNLLLISLDTVRADHCSAYGYGRSTTPVLEALSAEGIVCDAAYSVSPITAPSHATLFTGLMPQTHGLRVNGERLSDFGLTLAERLTAAGYQTAGVAGSFVLNRTFGLDRGFEFWDDYFPAEGSKHPSSEWMGHEVPAGFDRRADQTTEIAADFLRDSRDPDRPFFLFVHYFEPHGPYVPPDRWRKDFPCDQGSSELESMVSAYDAGLAFTDDEVGRLLKVLDEMGSTEDTIVIVTADHGEGLMTHGAMAHGQHLYDEAVRIPLMFRWPNRLAEGRKLAPAVSLADLAPTILELLGINEGAQEMDGRSFAPWLLSPSVEGVTFPVFMFRGKVRRAVVEKRWIEGERFGVLDGQWKFLTSESEEDELFDLEADPKERMNLASSYPQEVERLELLLNPWVRMKSPTDGSGITLSLEESQILEALGYGF